MRTFAEQIEALVDQGYEQVAAQAKVAHDTVLRAMDSSMKTISFAFTP